MNQDDFNYKALEQLKIIASRLESIERMLGAESKQEPEWRQMSTAPNDRDIEVKVNGEVNTVWYYGKDEWNVSGYILHEVYNSGWRPL